MLSGARRRTSGTSNSALYSSFIYCTVMARQSAYYGCGDRTLNTEAGWGLTRFLVWGLPVQRDMFCWCPLETTGGVIPLVCTCTCIMLHYGCIWYQYVIRWWSDESGLRFFSFIVITTEFLLRAVGSDFVKYCWCTCTCICTAVWVFVAEGELGRCRTDCIY